MEFPLPRVIDRYRLESRLGSGGMGVVYRGLDMLAHRPVAVKLLHAENTASEAAQRFVREVKHTAKLRHPNVIEVIDIGKTAQGELYFVMELLAGESLATILHRQRRLPVARSVKIATQVCAALAAAHQRGIVHRDVKPANLMVMQRKGDDELVKVLDFGIARDLEQDTQLTGTGMIIGTTEYLAPEQILAGPFDGRADMYAVGVVLFRMLTGTSLFPNAHDNASLMYHQVHVAPDALTLRAPDAQIPPEIERVVLRCLKKDPNERFADMAELAIALEAAAQGAPVADDKDLEELPFRRCAVCEAENSRFVVRCANCGGDLGTPEQKAFMHRLIASRRMAEAAERASLDARAAPPSPGAAPSGTATVAERLPPSAKLPLPAAGIRERARELLGLVPAQVWNRVLGYSLLALLAGRIFGLFGNGTSAILLVGILVGVLGLWARARD